LIHYNHLPQPFHPFPKILQTNCWASGSAHLPRNFLLPP
jgi:hypothetical protein